MDEVQCGQLVSGQVQKLQFVPTSVRLVLIRLLISYLSYYANVLIEFYFIVVEIRVGRTMMIISIALSGIGVFVSLAGLSCTRCLDGEDRLKDKVAFTGGCLFILSGTFNFLIHYSVLHFKCVDP